MSVFNRRPALLVVVVVVVALAGVLAAAGEWLALGVFAAAGVPFLHLMLYPWRACRWCEKGKVWDGSHTAFDDCDVCDGRGRRPRWLGAGLWIRRLSGMSH